MKTKLATNPKLICETCNHQHYKKSDDCPNCNCGESEKMFADSWRGYNPDVMYNGYGNPYERTNSELNLYND